MFKVFSSGKAASLRLGIRLPCPPPQRLFLLLLKT